MAFSLMTAKVVSIVVVGLMLTMVNAIGNFIAYGHGVSGRLMIRYMMLVVMNGVAVLSLSLLAGNVLLGLSIYFLVPILLKPFIVYLVPAVSDLFYSSAIRSLADGALPLQNSLVSLVWLLVFLLAGYLSIVVQSLNGESRGRCRLRDECGMQREFQRFSSIIPQHFLRVIMAEHGKWRNPAILIINDVGCYVRQTIDLDGIPQYCGASRKKWPDLCVIPQM